MSNVALIFAGGSGKRMNTKAKPKQFLELHGKPIIIYTLEEFENHPEIDGIVVVCLGGWENYLQKLLVKFGIQKVRAVVTGGKCGQESIFNGLVKIHELYASDSIVLVHDGVRPLIDAETIHEAIECVKRNGSAITTSPAIETITVADENEELVGEIIDRKNCRMAKAPQCFYLGELYEAHLRARKENKHDFIDSASMMRYYGHPLYTVEGSTTNIKITTPTDFYIFRAIVDAKESEQILGL